MNTRPELYKEPKEEALAKADIQSWRGFRKGTVEVMPTSLRVYVKSAFWRKASLQADFENSAVNSFRIEGNPSRSLILNLIVDGEEHIETIDINGVQQAQEVFLALRKTMGPLDEKSREQRKREEEELELQEKARQRKQSIESYVGYVWKVAGGLHAATSLTYGIVAALSREDWDAAKGLLPSLLHEADILQEHGGFAMASALRDLREAFEAGIGQDAANSCSAFIDTLSAQCLEEQRTHLDWEDTGMEGTVCPSRFRLSYWLLLSALCAEVKLDGEVAEWLSVDQAISTMRKLCPVVADGFGVETADCVTRLNEASAKMDSLLIARYSDDLEELMGGATSKRWYREVNLS